MLLSMLLLMAGEVTRTPDGANFDGVAEVHIKGSDLRVADWIVDDGKYTLIVSMLDQKGEEIGACVVNYTRTARAVSEVEHNFDGQTGPALMAQYDKAGTLGRYKADSVPALATQRLSFIGANGDFNYVSNNLFSNGGKVYRLVKTCTHAGSQDQQAVFDRVAVAVHYN